MGISLSRPCGRRAWFSSLAELAAEGDRDNDSGPRATDILEKCGFTLQSTSSQYRVDVAFSGPFVSNGENAASLAWTLFSCLTADYGVQTWSARMKVYDMSTGKVCLCKDYSQKYESYVWGPIPIYSPAGSVKSSFNFMQNWCLSALTDLAMADATAFLSARAR